MERTKDSKRKCHDAKSRQVKAGSHSNQEGYSENRGMEKLSTRASDSSAKPSNQYSILDGPQLEVPYRIQTTEKENVDSNCPPEDDIMLLGSNKAAHSQYRIIKSTKASPEEARDADQAHHLHHRIKDWAVIRYEKHIFLEGNVCDTDGTKHLYRTSGVDRVSSSVDVAQKFVTGFPADWKSYRLRFMPPARPHSLLSNNAKPKSAPKSRTTKKKGKSENSPGPNHAILPPTPPTDALLTGAENHSIEKKHTSPPVETSDSRSAKTERKRKSATELEKATLGQSEGLGYDEMGAVVAGVPDSVRRPKRPKKASGSSKKKKKEAKIASESNCLSEDNAAGDCDDVATAIETMKDSSSALIVEVQFDNFATASTKKRGKSKRKPSSANPVECPEVSETPASCHIYPTRQLRPRKVTNVEQTTRSGRRVRKPNQPSPEVRTRKALAKKKAKRESGRKSSKTLFAERKTAENSISETEEKSASRLSVAAEKAQKRSRKPVTGGRSQSLAKADKRDASRSALSRKKCAVLLSPLQERHYEGLVVGNISLTAEDKSDRDLARKDSYCGSPKSAAKSNRNGKSSAAKAHKSRSRSKKKLRKSDSEAVVESEVPAAVTKTSRKGKGSKSRSRSKKTQQEGVSDDSEAFFQSEVSATAAKPSQKVKSSITKAPKSRSRSKKTRQIGVSGYSEAIVESEVSAVAAKPSRKVKASIANAPKKSQQKDGSGHYKAIAESEASTRAGRKIVSPRKKRKKSAKPDDSAAAVKPARKVSKKRKTKKRDDSSESSETIVATPQKDFWNAHRKGRLRKMVYQYLTWDEIGACLKVSPAKCKKVFRDMQSNRKEKKADTAKPAPVTARRGTMKHREEMRRYLGDATTRSNLPKQDIFHGQVEDHSNDPFFAAMCEEDGFVPVTPNSRPPWLETDCTTPAWFKTPTGQSGAQAPRYDETPAALKEIWYRPAESGNEQAAKKETDRVILQLGKKMAKGGARLAKSAKVPTPSRKKKMINSIDLDTIGTTDSSAYESGGEKDDYFDLENE